MVITETFCNASEQLLITRISGDVDMEDVEKWEQSLQNGLHKIQDKGTFKILVNLHGFKALNLNVHRKFREIVPKTLSDYGWRVGYLDMFPEAQIELKNHRGIQCTAAAHVHHDESKINHYENYYSRSNERFFTDPVNALEWIQKFTVIQQPINSIK